MEKNQEFIDGHSIEECRMKNLTIENIAKACEGKLVANNQDIKKEVTGAVIDSRQVKKDFLFIPIKGARVDGHDFIPQVIKQGACVVLSERELDISDCAYILVEKTTEAMKKIAEFYREQLDIKIVGITGSVGKTSTKEMISSVLSQKYEVLKTAGNFNNEIGLPLTIFNIHRWHEIAVLEMGISDFDEMNRLSTMSKPDIQVITNIGVCHLENLKTRDGILKAKTECFDHMSKDGVVILNGDDDKLCTKKIVNGKNSIFYGIDKEAKKAENGELMAEKSIYATDVKNEGFEGILTKVHTNEGTFEARISIPGEHNVYNALAATAVGLEAGLNIDEIKKGVESAKTIAGRTNFIKVNGMTVIDDCYNANPASMQTALEILSHATGRSVAILGDMGELGEDEVHLHEIVGESVAKNNIDVLFATGKLAKNYAKKATELNEKCDVHYNEKLEELLKELDAFVKKGDTILVKASHFMEFPKVVDMLKNK
ncbi:UDP-N-acetylmuramoyl-tripeptide--D-alanyl-D-alanine ligase [Lachnospiraceae bacterium C7]|nr:UDP-N-acetylmuramoyl-tripeptide--D-alanyl-D-alanine ligase [Lachnospiraceae bacterium C7]